MVFDYEDSLIEWKWHIKAIFIGMTATRSHEFK